MKQLFGYIFLLCALLFIVTGYAQADLADDLVVYFSFDTIKGKRVLDESGNGLDAEVIENTKFVEGKYGNAVHITRRTEDCVNVPTADKLEIDSAITMMAWVYHEDWTGSSSQWFDKGSFSEDFNSSYGMGVFGKDHPVVAGWLANDSGIGVILGGELQMQLIIHNRMKNKTWHHIVGTCEGTSFKIYLDGKVLVREAMPFGFTGVNDQDLRIGCTKGKPQYAFEDGAIDEVAIWSRALGEDEIKTAMQGPLFDVTPQDKVATTWGDIKEQVFQP